MISASPAMSAAQGIVQAHCKAYFTYAAQAALQRAVQQRAIKKYSTSHLLAWITTFNQELA